jgi:phosphoribosylanthranilate isomerase
MNDRFIIKICGVMNPEDALFAAQTGATHIGMLLWKKTRRSVSRQRAQEIACATHEGGALSVGVFVEGSLSDIEEVRNALGLDCVQLSGPEVKPYAAILSKNSPCFLAVDRNSEGDVKANEAACSHILYKGHLLYDYGIGGSGKRFCWDSFIPLNTHPWILAGGLNVDNVIEGIKKLNPHGVDVSSGVENRFGTAKDKYLIKSFIEKAAGAAYKERINE